MDKRCLSVRNTRHSWSLPMTYISLLRGINIAGQKAIKMADLQSLYQSLDFQNITTYIQSGNVIFDSPTRSANTLQQQIQSAIQTHYNFHVPVILRTARQFKTLIQNCPYHPIDLPTQGSKTLVTFYDQKPTPANINTLKTYIQSPDQLIIQNTHAYLHCPNGYGRTKLNNNFQEAKLKTQATTRNWKTILKLYELSTS